MNMLILFASLWTSFANPGGVDRPTAEDRWQTVLAQTVAVTNATDQPVRDRYSQRFGYEHRHGEGADVFALTFRGYYNKEISFLADPVGKAVEIWNPADGTRHATAWRPDCDHFMTNVSAVGVSARRIASWGLPNGRTKARVTATKGERLFVVIRPATGPDDAFARAGVVSSLTDPARRWEESPTAIPNLGLVAGRERTRFGGRDIEIVFDTPSGRVLEYRVQGELVATGNRNNGPYDHNVMWRGRPKAQVPTGAAFDRIGPDTLRVTYRIDQMEVRAHYQLATALPGVRSWYEITWRGEGEVTNSYLNVNACLFPVADGKGMYLTPGVYPPRRYTRETWGKEAFGLGGEGPVIAESGTGWSVLGIYNPNRPYCDAGAFHVTANPKAKNLNLFCCIGMGGYFRKDVTQWAGDTWLVFRRGGAEEMLKYMHAYHAYVGHRKPEGCPDWVWDLNVYSAHPKGRVFAHGDFNDLTRRLELIRRLGCNLVWVRPVTDTDSYCPDDLFHISKNWGTEADFRHFVDTAHGLGLRVFHDAVPHGGSFFSRRAHEHPEWVCKNRQGIDFDNYWHYDFNNPAWIATMGDWAEYETRAFGLDGYRMDVPTGSRSWNWNPAIPYARASWAGAPHGGLNMIKSIRGGARRANPQAIVLAEANANYLFETCDLIYDQPLCHGRLHELYAQGVAEGVADISRWLEDQRLSFIPDATMLRYTESHDAIDACTCWGRDAATALMAYCAWIRGVPLVWDDSEEGDYERYRHIFAVRRALKELRRGEATYLVPGTPPGVFACRRWMKDEPLESVFYVNMNERPVAFDRLREDGGARVELKPFEYRVFRLRGPSVDEALKASGYDPTPVALGCAAKGADPVVEARRPELTPIEEGRVKIAAEKTAHGIRYRVTDFGGLPTSRVYLCVRLPAAERWYARAAEGTFEGPFYERYPHAFCPVYRSGGRSTFPNERWYSRVHPFGFDRAHAAVGGIAGGTAYECFGFSETADVRLYERMGDDSGLAVSVTGEKPEDFVLELETLPARTVESAGRPSAGTGDERLTVICGGWRYEEGDLRVDIRRTGAVLGVWRKTSGGTWRKALGHVQLALRRGDAPDDAQFDWVGRDSAMLEQLYSREPYEQLWREPDGTLRFKFDTGRMRGLCVNAGDRVAITPYSELAMNGKTGLFEAKITFKAGQKFRKGDWKIAVTAQVPEGVVAPEVVGSVGMRPVAVGRNRQGDFEAVFHDPKGADLEPKSGWFYGVKLRVPAVEKSN